MAVRLDPLVSALRDERRRQGLSQPRLAERARLSFKTIESVERGRNSPTLYTVRRYLEGLSRTVVLTDRLPGAGERQLRPCGTPTAYRRHIDRGERPCLACADSNRVYERERKRARREQPVSTGTGWPA